MFAGALAERKIKLLTWGRVQMSVQGVGMETWSGEGCVPLPFAGVGFCGLSLRERFVHCVAERDRVSGL